jgi:hypothetical protein
MELKAEEINACPYFNNLKVHLLFQKSLLKELNTERWGLKDYPSQYFRQSRYRCSGRTGLLRLKHSK